MFALFCSFSSLPVSCFVHGFEPVLCVQPPERLPVDISCHAMIAKKDKTPCYPGPLVVGTGHKELKLDDPVLGRLTTTSREEIAINFQATASPTIHASRTRTMKVSRSLTQLPITIAELCPPCCHDKTPIQTISQGR